MAVDAPLITRQRLLAAKVETTTGTAESLANADGALNIFDPALTADVPFNERPGQSALSPLPGVPGARSGSLTFESELVGSGSASTNPGWAESLLLACGFAESSQVFTPVTGSASYTTLTMGLYEDGRLRSLAGAAGNVAMNFTAGNPVRLAWDFSGVLQPPTAAALLTPTYPTVEPPRFAAATLTVGGTAYKVNELSINLNNELAARQDATHVSGYHSYVIANRRVTVTMDPESVAFGTKNWYTDWLAGTEAALNIVVGSASDNTMTINLPQVQLTNVQAGDRGGVMTDQLEFQANRSASAGDDEIAITFS